MALDPVDIDPVITRWPKLRRALDRLRSPSQQHRKTVSSGTWLCIAGVLAVLLGLGVFLIFLGLSWTTEPPLKLASGIALAIAVPAFVILVRAGPQAAPSRLLATVLIGTLVYVTGTVGGLIPLVRAGLAWAEVPPSIINALPLGGVIEWEAVALILLVNGLAFFYWFLSRQ